MAQKSVADTTDEVPRGKDVNLRIRGSYGKELDPVSQVTKRKKYTKEEFGSKTVNMRSG